MRGTNCGRRSATTSASGVCVFTAMETRSTSTSALGKRRAPTASPQSAMAAVMTSRVSSRSRIEYPRA